MTPVIRPVHPGLRGLLAGPMVAYDVACDPAAVHLGVPGTTATVILSVAEPLDVGWLGEFGSERLWSSVSGLHLRPAVIRTAGSMSGIQLDLTPRGCRVLLGMPIGAVAHATTELPVAAFREGMDERPGWAARLEWLEQRLLERRGSSTVPADVEHACVLLSRGVRVREVAAETGWSETGLRKRMVAETGLRPKQFGRLGRLDRARDLRRRGMALADIAHETGFSDQAHLSREWRTLAGQAPDREQEFVFLQDLPAR